jgi:hypothetical protein
MEKTRSKEGGKEGVEHDGEEGVKHDGVEVTKGLPEPSLPYLLFFLLSFHFRF